MNLIDDVVFIILNSCEPINIITLSLVNKQFYRIHHLEIIWHNVVKNINEDVSCLPNKITFLSKYIIYYQLNKLNVCLNLNKSTNQLINLLRELRF